MARAAGKQCRPRKVSGRAWEGGRLPGHSLSPAQARSFRAHLSLWQDRGHAIPAIARRQVTISPSRGPVPERTSGAKLPPCLQSGTGRERCRYIRSCDPSVCIEAPRHPSAWPARSSDDARSHAAIDHAWSRRPCPLSPQAYWAMPWPRDQFSFATSTRFTNTSSGRMPGLYPSSSAIRRNSAFFCSTVSVLFAVI